MLRILEYIFLKYFEQVSSRGAGGRFFLLHQLFPVAFFPPLRFFRQACFSQHIKFIIGQTYHYGARYVEAPLPDSAADVNSWLHMPSGPFNS